MKRPERILTKAVLGGPVGMLRSALAKGACPSYAKPGEPTPLVEVLRQAYFPGGDVEQRVRLLLDAGACVLVEDGHTPPLMALLDGMGDWQPGGEWRLAVCRELCDKGADPLARDAKGRCVWDSVLRVRSPRTSLPLIDILGQTGARELLAGEGGAKWVLDALRSGRLLEAGRLVALGAHCDSKAAWGAFTWSVPDPWGGRAKMAESARAMGRAFGVPPEPLRQSLDQAAPAWLAAAVQGTMDACLQTSQGTAARPRM